MSRKIAPAVAHYRSGGFLIVLDDESRENEGDLIIAGEHASVEKIAFMVRHTSGLICVPMTNERADALGLPLMVARKESSERHGTAYTISVDYALGTTTGISAHDRSLTINKLADPTSTDTDFLRPGHVFPLRSHDAVLGGRRGHTEATIALCRLAGCSPVGAICELVRGQDGSMARFDDCIRFGKEHSIPVITIEDIQNYITSQANLSA